MLQGLFHPGGVSRQLPARLEIDARGRVSCPEAGLTGIELAALEISPRIGDGPRYLGFPDGACFETRDNDGVDLWVRRHGHASRRSLLVHRLESAGRFVVGTAAATLLCGFLFVRWGLPWLSEQAAYALPAAVSQALGSGTLQLLDEHLLEASELPPERQAELSALFAAVRPERSAFALRLVLRRGAAVGANAFALPDGTVVLTDELVRLAGSEEQIAGVMLHEIGHVEHRHGLRGALQSAGLAALVVAVAGDVSAANSLAVTLPVFLVEARYSRRMEAEADRYAALAMLEQGLAPTALVDFLYRLEHPADGARDAAGKGAPGDGPDPGWLGYLSTHPLGEDRLRPLRALIAERQGTR